MRRSEEVYKKNCQRLRCVPGFRGSLIIDESNGTVATNPLDACAFSLNCREPRCRPDLCVWRPPQTTGSPRRPGTKVNSAKFLEAVRCELSALPRSRAVDACVP